MTGRAINASIASIASGNYPNGVPKILVILTDGVSYDDVFYAAGYARSQGITLFCVGIGGGINNAQLLQIAGTQSNVLYISTYGNLEKLAELI
jgi:matrilin-3